MNILSEKMTLLMPLIKNSKSWKEDVMVAKFNIVSACLSNYLPHIKYEEHENIFKEILLQQQLSIFEQSFYDLPDYIVYENLDASVWELLKNKPSIICTYHTGSYRLLNVFLAKNKIPYSLVISKEAIQSQGESFTRMFAELNGNTGTASTLTLIDAESPACVLQMARELKNGKHLVVYIDGNTGAGTETLNNHNHCAIDFLNQQIFARKGVGFLAHTMKVPVLPVASFRKSTNDIHLKFFEPVMPDTKQDRALFAENLIKHIYSLVAPIISQYPAQWEAWLYLNKVACVNKTSVPSSSALVRLPAANDKLSFNSAGFGIFKIVKNSFLFKKSNYESFKISSKVYSQLRNCAHAPVLRKDIDIPEFDELFYNNVLVKT